MGEVGVENSRDALPARYLLKIESFSSLSENGICKYESNEFHFHGYNWKMIVHPGGNGDGQGHISLYLAIVGTSSLHADWEEWRGVFAVSILNGVLSKCVSHATFEDPSNGYLVNDKCIFGVDVYVIKNQGIGACLSLLNGVNPYKHEWKINEFTKLKNHVYSDEFTVEGYKWKLLFYPTGDSRQNGQNISVFPVSVNAEGFDRQKRVRAKFSISVKNQISGEDHTMSGGANWYSAAACSWGWPSFMPCCEFNDPKKGFLVGDCCIVEADVSVVAAVDCLT